MPLSSSPLRALRIASVRLRMLIPVCLLLAFPAVSGWSLSASPELSSDGVVRLHWDGPGARATLREASDDGFANARDVYSGTDRASLISGKPNGVYHYRLLNADGVVVATTTARVEHHPLSRAWTFFAIGLGVFLATVVLVVRGARSES